MLDLVTKNTGKKSLLSNIIVPCIDAHAVAQDIGAMCAHFASVVLDEHARFLLLTSI